jgi:plasmid stability protein
MLGSQQNGLMKTTLDLPDALIKQVKLRAIHEGRKLKDEVADLLRKGLAVAAASPVESVAPRITRAKKTGLPLIMCKHPASVDEELTPERVADILLAQEAEWHHAAGR